MQWEAVLLLKNSIFQTQTTEAGDANMLGAHLTKAGLLAYVNCGSPIPIWHSINLFETSLTYSGS